MKKVLLSMVAATAIAGVASADMYAAFSVGYGLFDESGAVGLVPDTIGQTIELYVVSGLSGISDNGSGGYVVNPALFNVISSSLTTVDAVGNFEDFAYGEQVILNWQTFDPNMYFVGVGSSGAAVVSSSSNWNLYPSDRPFDSQGTPEVVYVDNNGAGINANASVVPEPGTIGLMGIAGIGMLLARKKAHR